MTPVTCRQTASFHCGPLPRFDLNGTILVLMLATLVAGARQAAGAVIPVTTVHQKISSTGGCSLQEAIYSANFDSNVAIARYDGATPVVVTTDCVAGSGDDIIVLPAGAQFSLSRIVDDADNPTGPTATPIITSTITVLAYGATLQRTSSANFRLFAVGSTGHLTLRRAYISGFRAQGGAGQHSGGGGMGAGGAIYVMGGALVVESSTFAGNEAVGGKGGGWGQGGGGGGMGGSGGPRARDGGGGGGGGGARGNGGGGGVRGGGGGGTVSSGAGGVTRRGGFDCGGDGGSADHGHDARCPGGGGGGAGDDFTFEPFHYDAKDGGDGHYGGGGGGGALHGVGSGGRGGFGGGGGAASGIASFDPGNGGDGGFGGGGGAGTEASFAPDGDGGDGGFFAGKGKNGGPGGGGGAGLGGAIFNDSGTLAVGNSTFFGNVTGGGFSEYAQDGVSGGGAIFSRNGHLTVLNTTISDNLSHIGGGILVLQDSESAPTSLVLQNTIIANNGTRECAITGFSIAAAFAGNLIENNADGTSFQGKAFAGCGGVVASGDPQLGILAYNQGPTPTMAIGTASPAWNAADPGTSLAVDQRRQERPSMGGFDIGAFELCLEGFGKLQQPCLILAGADPDAGESTESVELTVQVQPSSGGTTTPGPGTQVVPENSVIPLKALPNAGFRFAGWSANVTNPGEPSTTVFMNAPQVVTANFEACACAADVTSAIAVTRGGITLNPMTRRYVQTVTLRNNSAAAITGPISLVLDRLSVGVTLYNPSGITDLMLPSGSPYRSATTDLAPGQTVSIQLQFTNPGNITFSYDTRVLAGPGSR